MGNDWINIAGLLLPNGTTIPVGVYTLVGGDGVEAVVSLENNRLSVKDKGSVSRFDDITLMNMAPDLYNISTGNFTGDISIEEYPDLRLSFTNNALTSINY